MWRRWPLASGMELRPRDERHMMVVKDARRRKDAVLHGLIAALLLFIYLFAPRKQRTKIAGDI